MATCARGRRPRANSICRIAGLMPGEGQRAGERAEDTEKEGKRERASEKERKRQRASSLSLVRRASCRADFSLGASL